MEEIKAYKTKDAIRLMGILAADKSVPIYIDNLYKDGMFKTSYKCSNRWCITEEDILYIREQIVSGRYKPSAKYKKAA